VVLYLFEDFSLDSDRRELRGPAGPIRLEPQVFDLLVYLIRNRDRVVTKDDLIAAVWDGRIVSESALTTRINAARTAVGDSGEVQCLIKTFTRKGHSICWRCQGGAASTFDERACRAIEFSADPA
jgi:DNA-binding winged helix-turn-helix (wHTH) protein